MPLVLNRCYPIAVLLPLLIAGCSAQHATVLGKEPLTQPTTQVKSLTAGTAGIVTVSGEMVEKCPIAGCWFRLRDKTGIVRVDTKQAGFVVSEVPLHTTMTVSGTVAPGTEIGLKATGVRY